MAVSNYQIAVIPGDGIGKEVVPEGIKVLETLAPRFDISLDLIFPSNSNISTGAANAISKPVQ
jgi:isocitrate/isopropylmalate dehydrogenase